MFTMQGIGVPFQNKKEEKCLKQMIIGKKSLSNTMIKI